MLDRSLYLQNVSYNYFTINVHKCATARTLFQVITLFVNIAGNLFGQITTIRNEGCIVKEIPWTAFALSADDWRRVADARDILAVWYMGEVGHHCVWQIRVLS